MTHTRNARPREDQSREAGRQSFVQATTATTITIAAPPGGRQRTGTAASVWMHLEPWVRASPAQRQRLADAVAAGRQEAYERRRRVLAHPDIAARLVGLGCSRPEHWNGYIPPKVAHYLDGGAAHLNDGAVRRELIAILRAVVEREQEVAA